VGEGTQDSVLLLLLLLLLTVY